MKTNTSTSQKVGLAIFAIGAVYMFGLGWRLPGIPNSNWGGMIPKPASLRQVWRKP